MKRRGGVYKGFSKHIIKKRQLVTIFINQSFNPNSMSVDATQRQKMKKVLKELETYRGRHTELVTVYIPADYDLNKIISHLAQEQGTATNIKSASTRKNVIDALERMIQHLRLYTRTPEHGLAAFSGNVAEREGVSDVRVWSIEPPMPLKVRIYRCDKEFVLEPLKEMMEVKEVYALCVMDRREGDVALLKGKAIIPVVSIHSTVPGKYKTGGQSAHRFEQNRELAAKEFYRRLADHMKDQLFQYPNLKGILVGGPGPTKYEFVDGDFMITDLKNKVIAIKDLSYTGEFGLQELLERSSDVLAQEGVSQEKQLMQKFFDILAKKPGMVTYGLKQTEESLELGIVDTLLLSEETDDDIFERLERKAGEKGSNVEVISVETREGIQLKEMGKIAAILRYEYH